MSFNELSAGPPGRSSAEMRAEVDVARAMQDERFAKSTTRSNAKMSSREIREHCKLGSIQRERMRAAVTDMGLSARAHDKILRVARTIADLESSESMEPHHIEEAINYRMLDRDIFH